MSAQRQPSNPKPGLRYSFLELFVWGTARGHTTAGITKGIGMLSAFLIVTKLSVYSYGLYQLVLAALAIIVTFSAGLFDDIIGNDLARAFAAKDLARAKRLFAEFSALKVGMGLAASAALFFGANIVAQYYGKDIASLVRIGSILLIVRSLRAAESAYFSAALSFVTYGAGIFEEVIRLGVLGAFLLLGGLDVARVLWASVIAALAVLGYVSVFFLRDAVPHFAGGIAARRSVLVELVRRYGRWVFLRYGFSKVSKNMDVVLIRFFLNTESVGYYSVAMNLIVFIQNFLPTRMLSVLLPWETERPARLGYIYRLAMKYGVWIGAAAAIGGFVFIPPALRLILPKYAPVMPLFRVLIFTLPLYMMYRAQKIFLLVLREQKLLTMRLITEALVTGAVLVVFLPLVGLYAVVVEYFVTYIFRVLLYSVYIRRSYPGLKVRIRNLVVVQRSDWDFFVRALREVLHPERWLRPIRIDTESIR